MHLPAMDTNDIHYRLNRFTDRFSVAVLAGSALALVGMLMKMKALPGAGLVFVLAMGLLMLLLVLQILVSFVYVTNHWPLALLGAFCSLGLALGFLAIIFRYQLWMGWRIMLIISLPVYLLSGVCLLVFLLRRKRLHGTQRKFLYRNLLIPFAFTMLLFLIAFSLRPAQFQKTFKPNYTAKHEIFFETAP